MERTSFGSVNYSQQLDTCVLASYAVACLLFTGTPVLAYFVRYRRHFNKLKETCPKLDETHPERSYQSHFHPLSCNKPGYQILKQLHDESNESSFLEARKRVTLGPLIDWSSGYSAVEAAIRQPDCLLLLFVNASRLPGLPSGHSIVVGHDGGGLYYLDTGRAQADILQAGSMQIADFGPPGDAYLVRRNAFSAPLGQAKIAGSKAPNPVEIAPPALEAPIWPADDKNR